jgi:hypothetical protein
MEKLMRMLNPALIAASVLCACFAGQGWAQPAPLVFAVAEIP